MRIIAGKHRGRVLAEFRGMEIRPTSDRVKESLFQIIGDRLAGARVLDLFCGSGNLGIECLSRGAASVDFNDISPQSVKVLKGNLARLKGENVYTVTTGDYAAFLNNARGAYDLIFIDPPYALDVGLTALKIIAERSLLTDGGVAVYERDRPFEGTICGLEAYDERKYGKTYLTFFRPAKTEE